MKVMIGILMVSLLMTGCAMFDRWIPGESNSSYVQNVSDLISYGVDNNWMNINPQELGNALISDGKCTMTSIEFLGWGQSGYYDNPEPLFDKFDKFIAAMRARKIWVLVSICNGNKGLGKYGDDRKGLDQYKPQLIKVVSYLKSKGPEGIIIQPVGETQDATGRWFEQYCAQQFVGFKLCWNNNSRPSAAPAGWWTFAYHPASTSDKGKARGITITDHSGILRQGETNSMDGIQRQLNIGGDLFGYADANKLESYTKEVLKTKDRGFGHYGFGHKKIDHDTIKAIGRAVSAVR